MAGYESSRKNNPVSRRDIEIKLHELDEMIEEATNSVSDVSKIVIVAGVALLVVGAFFLGRRRALRKRTVVTLIKKK